MFEGTAEQALGLVLLALVIGTVAGTVVQEVRAGRQHRRTMARLAQELEPEDGCDWYEQGGAR